MAVYLSVFALTHIFQLIMTVDAVYARNTLQFMSLIIFNLLFLFYTIIQISEVKNSSITPAGILHVPVNVLTDIIPAVISATEIVYIGLGRKIYNEFGWKVYKFHSRVVDITSQGKLRQRRHDCEQSSTPGSQSSAGTPIASMSSVISAKSAVGTGPPKRGRPKGSKTGMGRGALAAQQKRPSPPRLPPPPAPAVRIEPDYLVDVEGDETGLSTDTDG
ncbi:hypothetical protein AZE42_02533 [Rhizopogon vesiculosus]|uniref:Uncharacterized protein n=1 Tax=Rhizopogon vesiculosus TaxID=180088 RepID=A0A1J8RHH1_9AGAM|nr:hypothetical protein AZE42_02533 [Rhizopogon vesiculosus]